jgi:hypothetical protein
LFVGVAELRNFRYREIRLFAHRALAALAEAYPGATTVAMTLHGVGYGLDEAECFRSELAGLADAVSSGDYPRDLSSVVIVEQNPRGAARLKALLDDQLPDKLLNIDYRALSHRVGEQRAEVLRSVGFDSAAKKYVFVAMPMNPHTEDLFHYGIRQAIDSCGFLCERTDLTPAVGDILERIKQRIRGASFVVADLTDSNVNVYREVGYAWGRNVPTVLLVKQDQRDALGFDVRGQRHVVYCSIRDLETQLAAELRGLTE